MKRYVFVLGIGLLAALLAVWWAQDPEPGGDTGVNPEQDGTRRESAGRPGLLAGREVPPPVPTPAFSAEQPTPASSEPEPVVLEPVTLEVKVVDESGAPVEGIEILEKYLAPSKAWKTRSVGRSGLDGIAHVQVPDYTAILLAGQSERWHCSEILTLQEGTEELVFHVTELVAIEGRVLTLAGDPSPGSRVMALFMERTGAAGGGASGFTQHGPTDADGRFTLRIPPYVSKVQLMTFAKGGGQVTLIFDPRKQRAVVLQPRILPVIRGVVVSSAGEEIKSFAVDAHALDGGTVEAVSGGGGGAAFGVRVSAPGRYVVTVRPDQPGLACSKPLEVQAPIDGLRIVCPKGASLEGIVEGEGAEDFRVFYVRHRGPDARLVVTREARTKAKGAFLMDGLTEGDALLYAFRDGDERYALAERPALPAAGLKLTLQKGEQVRGRVVGYDGRRGYDLYIGLMWRGPTRWGAVQEDGSFRIEGLPPGTYGLMWSRGEHRVSLQQTVDAGAGDVDLSLPEEALSYGLVPPK